MNKYMNQMNLLYSFYSWNLHFSAVEVVYWFRRKEASTCSFLFSIYILEDRACPMKMCF